MKLEHIALSISDQQEIENFYTKILGMKPIKNFVLRKDLAVTIFNIDEEINVFLLQKDEVLFELFLTSKIERKAFDHICISIKNRDKLINKAISNGYRLIRIERELFDLIFIQDRDGNIFEIMEI